MIPKTMAFGATGLMASVTSVLMSLAQHAELGLRILTLLAGFVVTVMTGYWLNKLNRLKLQRELDKQCVACQEGHRPTHCPVLEQARPEDCPLNPE